MQLGPPLEIRFDEKKASGLIEKTGFSVGEIRNE
jgi:hypothetical protein